MSGASVKKAVLLLTILLLPSLIYVFLSTGKHRAVTLPVFGPKPLDGSDTIYHTLPDFSFVNQYSETIGRKDTEGKIVVADYFFTTCRSICPVMSSQMTRVQEKFKGQEDVIILSHTVNPEEDSVSVLYEYAQKHQAEKGKWHFLTGDKKHLYDLARNGYFITAMEGDGGPDDFIHSEKFVLVDKKGRIRGYYDGTNTREVSRLMDEIKVLKFEETIPRKSKTKKDD